MKLKALFPIFIVLLMAFLPATLAQQPATTEEPPSSQPVVSTPLIPLLPQVTPGGNAQPGLPGGAQPSLPGSQPAQPTAASTPVGTPSTGSATPEDDTPAVPSGLSSCPILVQEGFTATSLICDPLNPGEACIGNGVVEAAPRTEGIDFGFAQPGDRVSFNSLSELQLRTSDTDSGAWTVIKAQLALNTTDDSPPTEATLVIFGDVTIADDGEQSTNSARSAVVLATSGMNVRNAPNETGTVIWQLSPNETITVTGKTVDNNWIRIEIPSRYGGIGWVYAPFVDVEGGAETLPIVTAASPPPNFDPPEYGAMQAFSLLSAITDPTCTGTPDSGVLLQSPSGLASSVKVRINGVEIFVNGTIFIQAQAGASLVIRVLEGEASLSANGSSVTARSGEQAAVTMGANLEPSGSPTAGTFDLASMAALPFGLLPRPFALGGTIVGNIPVGAGGSMGAGAGIGSLPGSGEPDDAFSLQPAAAPTTAAVCTLRSRDGATKNIRQVPSINAGISGYLRPGESIQATNVGRDADGFSYFWYQTNQGWLRQDTVTASDGCAALTGGDAGIAAFVPTATLVPIGSVTPGTTTTGTTGPSLTISGLAEVTELCSGTMNYSTSLTVTTEELSFALGEAWTAAPGTVLTLSISDGAIFRGEYGDFIRLVDSGGNTLLGSGQQRAVQYTFTQPTTFTVNLSSSKGTFIIITMSCAAVSASAG